MHCSNVVTALAGALALLGAVATNAAAQPRDRDDGRRGGVGDWVELDVKRSISALKRDTVRVGRREGASPPSAYLRVGAT